jgi:hypothetical protein
VLPPSLKISFVKSEGPLLSIQRETRLAEIGHRVSGREAESRSHSNIEVSFFPQAVSFS